MFVLSLVLLGSEAFLLSFYSFFFPSTPSQSSSPPAVEQPAPAVPERRRHSRFLLCPPCHDFTSPKSQGAQDPLLSPAAPRWVLMVSLQLGLLRSYALHLVAKPFGELTKCLPSLLLRNVHMHMRAMNNAAFWACSWVHKRG